MPFSSPTPGSAVSSTAFLATVSHEVRTPLNAVIGMTELLRQMPLPPEAASLVETIHMSGEHVLALVNDLLDVARLDAGKLVLEHVDFVLRDVVEEAIAIAAATAGSKRLAIAAVIDPQLPDQVRGDPRRLGQVLANLLSNGVKFTSEGFVRLRLHAAATEADHVVCRVEVEDSGIGIDPEVLPHLFQPFAQASPASATRYGGTGLGLAIASGIVAAMQSRIEATSTPGRGSRFWFDVRLQRGRRTDALALPSCRGLHVVLASRDDMLVEALRAQAARLGLRVAVVGSVEPVPLLADTAPVALLLDTRLADAEAFRAAATAAGVPIVSLCDAREAVGRDRALRTPVRLAALARMVSTLRCEKDEDLDPAVATLPGGPWRVLVAEDNVANQELVTRVLARVGIHADVVGSGDAACAATAAHRYDFVFMDCRMPGMNGVDATRTIRARGDDERLAIVGMTASVLPGVREACLEAGMNDFLVKPTRPAALVDMLRRWLPEGPALPAPAAATPAPVSTDNGARERGRSTVDPAARVELVRLGLFEEFVGVVQREMPRRLQEMAAALDRGDRVGLTEIAHRMTTLLGNVGWSEAADLASRLETASVEQDRVRHVELARLLAAVVETGWPEVEDLVARGQGGANRCGH